MYAFFALLTLGLAALAQGASSNLAAAVREENLAAALAGRQMRSVKLGAEGSLLHLKLRGGDALTVRDPEAYSKLQQESTSRRTAYGAAKSVGFSRINNMFSRSGTNCADLCVDEGCSTSTSTGNCSCLKDCGPEGEECFSTCFHPSK